MGAPLGPDPTLTPGPYPPWGPNARREAWRQGRRSRRRLAPLLLGLLGAILVLLVVVLLFDVSARFGSGRGGEVLFFAPFGLLLVLFVVFFVVRIAWWSSWRRRPPRGPFGPDAREILRRRYARGELTSAQFEQMNRDLDRVGPPPVPPSRPP